MKELDKIIMQRNKMIQTLLYILLEFMIKYYFRQI